MRLRFLVDWPALSAEQARDPRIERYPAGGVAEVDEAFGKAAVSAEAAEVTTDPATVVWSPPRAEAEPAQAPAPTSELQQAIADAQKAEAHALDVLKATSAPAK